MEDQQKRNRIIERMKGMLARLLKTDVDKVEKIIEEKSSFCATFEDFVKDLDENFEDVSFIIFDDFDLPEFSWLILDATHKESAGSIAYFQGIIESYCTSSFNILEHELGMIYDVADDRFKKFKVTAKIKQVYPIPKPEGIIDSCPNCGCREFFATSVKDLSGRQNEDKKLELDLEGERITSIKCKQCGMLFEEDNFEKVTGW